MKTDDTISVLNELIEVSKDGEKGFHTSAQDAKSPELKSLLETYGQECAQAVNELQMCVRALGGDPEKSGTVLGAMHRGWVNVKAAASSRDDVAVLEECERGEDHAKGRYAKALQANLPPEVRSVVERQYNGTLRHHDKIRNLRDTYKRAA